MGSSIEPQGPVSLRRLSPRRTFLLGAGILQRREGLIGPPVTYSMICISQKEGFGTLLEVTKSRVAFPSLHRNSPRRCRTCSHPSFRSLPRIRFLPLITSFDIKVSNSCRTSLTISPASLVWVKASKDLAKTRGSKRAGWPRRTIGRSGGSRSTMLSTEMLEGPQTRTRFGGV